MTQPARTRTRRCRSPRRRSDPWLAPTLALVGLLVVAFVTLSLMNGSLPFVGGSSGSGNGTGNGTGNGGGGPILTPAPSNVVVVVPEVDGPGLDRLRQGRQHLDPERQTGTPAHRWRTRLDAVWSPDGKDIYFIRTTDEIGTWPSQGSDRRYQMTVPAVMRVRADGSGDPTRRA